MGYIRLIYFIIVFFLVISVQKCLAKDVVNYPWIGIDMYGYDHYYQDLLKFALDKSSERYGSYELNKIRLPTNQLRAIDLIYQEKYINVFWTMTSQERESKLLPVRVPLFNGLAGCRVFLINKEYKSAFDQLTFDEFILQRAGQGEDWPDTRILEYNKFIVLKGHDHNGLFMMLKKGRFDYFPRAIYEAYNEVATYPELAISDTKMFYYDSPMFFFVNKKNTRLHERLTYGLQAAIDDGSFETFFEQHEITSKLAKILLKNQHRVYHLENPLLSANTKKTLAALNKKFMCGANASYIDYSPNKH